MAFRKFAAHYVLLPDGSLGKWPVVELDTHGMVVSVTVNPHGFKEQPSLQYQGGILLPGFVDAWTLFSAKNFDQKDLNRHLVKGSLVLGSVTDDRSIKASHTPPFLIRGKITDETHECHIVSQPLNMPVWERLLLSVAHDPGVSMPTLLYEATARGADLLGVEAWFGRLSPGLFPGLLILENMDLHRFLPIPQTRVRWLVQPINPLL